MAAKSSALSGLFVIATFCPSAYAADVIISPGAEIVHVEFSAGYSGTIGGALLSNSYDVSVQALRVGISIASGNAYFDGYYQASNKGSDTLLFGGAALDYESERDECVVALGYKFSQNTRRMDCWIEVGSPSLQ